MKTLIVGFGEIGKSLYNVIAKHNVVGIVDPNYKDPMNFNYEIMHICFPYSRSFVEDVLSYKEKYKPKYTVIHSTVPIGTSSLCEAIHSPVIGIHPDLTESLLTFTKFLGGKEASEVANYFRRCGIKVHIEDDSDVTELLKIQSTTFYALMIEFCKDMKVQIDKLGGSYSSFLLWNDNYNKGYEELGYPEFKKPLLQPIMKKQGGHCTLPNLELIDTKFTKFLKSIV